MATIAPLPTLLLAAFAAVAMAGCAVSLDIGDDTTRRTEEQSIPLGSLTGLEVTTENGQIDVVAGAVTAVELRAVLVESDEGDATFEVTQEAGSEGERLVVEGECDGGWFDQCSVGFHVVVPEHFDVAVHTDNGRVGIDGVAGVVDVETDNGRVDGDALGAPSATVHTDNGRVELTYATTPDHIDVHTDNGGIVVRVPDGAAYSVDAATDNGSIAVAVADDPSADRTIRVRSDNGGIDVGYG